MDELNEGFKDISALELLTRLENMCNSKKHSHIKTELSDQELKNIVAFLKVYEEKRVLEKSITQTSTLPKDNRVKI